VSKQYNNNKLATIADGPHTVQSIQQSS